MVKASIKQLQEHGEVKRGRIGVTIQDINFELRKAFNLKNGQQGVLITSVFDNSSAQSAGIKSGDVIISVDGKPTKSTGQLRTRIGMKAIGEKVSVGLIRGGDLKHFEVDIGQIDVQQNLTQQHKLLEGVQLENNSNGHGVIIIGMTPNSFAAYSGLRSGDIILGVNKKPVTTIESLNKSLKNSNKKVLLRINRKGRLFYLVIR
jgi:S1-C subfamily serine protease